MDNIVVLFSVKDMIALGKVIGDGIKGITLAAQVAEQAEDTETIEKCITRMEELKEISKKLRDSSVAFRQIGDEQDPYCQNGC